MSFWTCGIQNALCHWLLQLVHVMYFVVHYFGLHVQTHVIIYWTFSYIHWFSSTLSALLHGVLWYPWTYAHFKTLHATWPRWQGSLRTPETQRTSVSQLMRNWLKLTYHFALCGLVSSGSLGSQTEKGLSQHEQAGIISLEMPEMKAWFPCGSSTAESQLLHIWSYFRPGQTTCPSSPACSPRSFPEILQSLPKPWSLKSFSRTCASACCCLKVLTGHIIKRLLWGWDGSHHLLQKLNNSSD